MRSALAALTGVLLALAFPRFGIDLLSLIALLPLLLAIELPWGATLTPVSPREAFRLGYIAGAVFFLILLYWIPFLPRENVTVPFLMYPMLLVMVAYLALYPAAAAAGSAWLTRRGAPLGLVFPPLWTLLEAVRGTGIFGFPWGSLGYAPAGLPHLIQFASITGVWGVSLWAALISGTVHLYLSARWGRPKALALVALAALVILPYWQGRETLLHRKPRAAVEVGIVQPNVGNNKWKLAVRDSVIEALLDQTEEFADRHEADPPRLIVWPETAVPARLPHDAVWSRRVDAMVDSIGIPVLAGFPDGVRLPDGSVRFTNSAGLILPGRGMVARYDKRHLVPFSEYFPLPILNRVDFGQSNFTPGKTPGLFAATRIPFGVLICFESIFPGYARELSRLGARYLVNITNDQWFGDSAAPAQHFEMNVLRCIENHMAMARAANTGISGAIDPFGFVIDRTPTFIRDDLVAEIELKRETTFYTRHGDWILGVCGAILLGFWASTLRGKGKA